MRAASGLTPWRCATSTKICAPSGVRSCMGEACSIQTDLWTRHFRKVNPRPRYSSHHLLERQRPSVHSISRVFVGDVGLNRPGGGDVGVAAGLIALSPLGEAARI